MLDRRFWYAAAIGAFLTVVLFQLIDAPRIVTAVVAMWGLICMIMLRGSI